MTHTPRKRFGQHFLKDAHVLQRIASEMRIQPNDKLIEIGPGKGALTEYLLSYVPHLEAVELDRDLIPILQQKFKDKLTIHQADALTFSFESLSTQPHDCRIAGNLPYNISTPLLFRLFDCLHGIQDMHFMLQKEVVDRITASVGDHNYGRLSVMTQYFCDTEYLFTVPPGAFEPPPKVDSAVLRLTPLTKREESANDFGLFSAVVKEAFTYRRKQLGNSLKKMISAKQLMDLNIDPNRRAQTLCVNEFVRISNAISATVTEGGAFNC